MALRTKTKGRSAAFFFFPPPQHPQHPLHPPLAEECDEVPRPPAFPFSVEGEVA